MALSEPYEYAWTLFLYLNRQARADNAGIADPTHPTVATYDANSPVVWETWARASGGVNHDLLSPSTQNESEVFRHKGERPVAWKRLERPSPFEKIFETNATLFGTLVPQIQKASDSTEIGFLSEPFAAIGEFEVRMNRSTYDTIRDNELYSLEGLEAKFLEATRTGNRDVVKFEPSSKEVKASWAPLVDPSDKDRYHWRTIRVPKPDGTVAEETYKLVALHIITKDLPNWFWTSFEHVDFELQANADNRPSVDPTTRGDGASHGRSGVRDETRNSKWEHYRLRGVQVEFVDKQGIRTRLGNTVIEPSTKGPSSCMTCHARATIGMRKPDAQVAEKPTPFQGANLLPAFVDGPPTPGDYLDPADSTKLQFIQTDFLWSLPFRARTEREP